MALPPTNPASPQASNRVKQEPTGVPRLDEVLGGGLPQGALIVILGPPGSGKTTLACQIAFAAARRGQRVLLLTALSESPSKLVEHLSHYQFFVPDFLGQQVEIHAMKELLPDEKAPMQEIITSVRKMGAPWVVLDGFQGLRGHGRNPQFIRQFLTSLGARLSMLGTTTLVTSESDPNDPTSFQEMTTADVLVALSWRAGDVWGQRGLEVRKIRGQAQLQGRHSMALSEQGVVVFPRLEAQITGPTHHFSTQVTPPHSGLRTPATFDLHELDLLLGGGLTRQTSTLLTGSLGTGKTILALTFALAGVRHKEPVLFLGFRETIEQLKQKMHGFPHEASLQRALAPGGRLTVQRWDPIELDPDQVATELLAALNQTGAQRLVIDSIAELERAVVKSSGRERLPDFLAALLAAVRQAGVTLLAIKETSKAITTELDFSAEALEVLTENLLLMQQVVWQGHLHRLFMVLKTRFAPRDPALREVRITAPKGLEVLSPTESEPGLLSNFTHS